MVSAVIVGVADKYVETDPRVEFAERCVRFGEAGADRVGEIDVGEVVCCDDGLHAEDGRCPRQGQQGVVVVRIARGQGAEGRRVRLVALGRVG